MQKQSKLKKAIRKSKELKEKRTEEIELIRKKELLYEEYLFHPKRKEKINKFKNLEKASERKFIFIQFYI